MKFKTRKIPLTEEEKRDRAEFFAEFTGESVDIEAFVKKDVFDEFVDFKCLNCKNEQELEADIVFELFDPNFEEYPLQTCPKCGKDKFVPKDIYDQLTKK